MSEFQNCTNKYNRCWWSIALVNCTIALGIYSTWQSWSSVTCTQGWVLMNFEENIQNNNSDIWNHHHYHETVGIVKGSHTPVIGSNFASHNASCFEDSKPKWEIRKNTDEPTHSIPPVLPLAVLWSWLWCGMHPSVTCFSEGCGVKIPKWEIWKNTAEPTHPTPSNFASNSGMVLTTVWYASIAIWTMYFSCSSASSACFKKLLCF